MCEDKIADAKEEAAYEIAVYIVELGMALEDNLAEAPMSSPEKGRIVNGIIMALYRVSNAVNPWPETYEEAED